MLNTYLNDNQRRPYPLYGGLKLPFPASCITGLGICLQEEGENSAIYASVVAIAKNSVRIALCRAAGANDEFIGMVYATTDGFYTYIPSSSDSAVYETDTIAQPVDIDRLVYGTYTTLPPDPIEAEVVALSDMQVFYAYVANIKQGILRSSIKSTGYMQLGTIPEDAVGVYTGRFYLYPSCVTYMPSDVLGYHAKLSVNQNDQETGHSIEFSASGVLTLAVDGGTLNIGCLPDTDAKNIFNEYPTHGVDFVEYVNGQTTSGLHTLTLTGFTNEITWEAQDTGSAIILTVNGTKKFPSCYAVQEGA